MKRSGIGWRRGGRLAAAFLAAVALAPGCSGPQGGYGGGAVPSRKPGAPVPATLPGIWAAVDTTWEGLAAAVDRDSLEEAARRGRRIEDLLSAMPPLSHELVPTRQGPLEQALRRAHAAVARLDSAAAAADTATARQARSALYHELDFIPTIYPPGALGS